MAARHAFIAACVCALVVGALAQVNAPFGACQNPSSTWQSMAQLSRFMNSGGLSVNEGATACGSNGVNGQAVYLQPPYNGSKTNSASGQTLYDYIVFSANVSCTKAGNVGNGCPSNTFVNTYNYTTVRAKQPNLPFLFPVKAVNAISSAAQGTNTLYFPGGASNTKDLNGVQTPGVFQFNMWGQSLCGKVASNPVVLAARCPPTPTACGVLRNAQTDSVIAQSNGWYTPQQGEALMLDGRYSHAFKWILPGLNYSQFSLTNAQWTTMNTTGFQWLNRNNIRSNPVACGTQSDKACSCNLGDTVKCLARFIKFNTAGKFTMGLTVMDGCSTGMTWVNINVQCSCTPTAIATAVPTVNTMTPGNPNGNLNNHVNAVNNANQNSQLVFALSGAGADYDPGVEFQYNWNFVNWIPNYSQMIGGRSYQSIVATTPPSSSCQLSNGDTVNSACWSSSNVVNSLKSVSRKTVGSSGSPYVYTVLYTVSPPGTQMVKNWVRTSSNQPRSQHWRFMRLAASCPPVVNIGFQPVRSWNSSVFNIVKNVTVVPAYASWTQATGNPDFNGFNSGGSSTVSQSSGNVFWPTTQFKAYVAKQWSNMNTTTMFTGFTRTPVCSNPLDLSFCDINIVQAVIGSGQLYTQNSANLYVSSIGSCRGLWTFQLEVSDGCGSTPAIDQFNVNVGCNRPASVNAGCYNNQVWAGSKKFRQINLDGRATVDPDNFGAPFYNLTLPNNMGASALTYAWALVSFPGYNGTTLQSAQATCPFTPKKKCAEPYCSGPGFIGYQNVNVATGISSQGTITSNSDANYGPSPQGSAMIYQAYNNYPMAYSQNTTNATTANVYLGAAQATPSTPEQLAPLFPLFRNTCAPTVFPKFFANSNGNQATGAVYGVTNTQHVGNSAYMSGMSKAGVYRVRLYAFDGCSVSWADVTFNTTCPSISFTSIPQLQSVYNMHSQPNLPNGIALRIPLSNTIVNYLGQPNVPIKVQVTLTNAAGVLTTVCTTADANGPGTSRIAQTSSSSCDLLVASAGTYTVQFRTTDDCVRQNSSSLFSQWIFSNTQTFTARCPYKVSTPQVTFTANALSFTFQQSQLQNFVPQSNGNGVKMPNQAITTIAWVSNVSNINGNSNNLSSANGGMKYEVSSYYSAQNYINGQNNNNNLGGLTYSTAAVYTSTQNVNAFTAQTFTMNGAMRSLATMSSRANPKVQVGYGYGFFQYQSSCASGDSSCPISNRGAYKVMVTATSQKFPCASASAVQYFTVSCAPPTQLVFNATATTNGAASGMSPLQLAPFYNTKMGGNFQEGVYSQGNNPQVSRFSGQTGTGGPGAFKKVGVTARVWNYFMCASGGCSNSNQNIPTNVGSNVVYNIFYNSPSIGSYTPPGSNQQTQNPAQSMQNTLGLAPYVAFNVSIGQQINPNGFSADPQIVFPTFPGNWQVTMNGQDICTISNYAGANFGNTGDSGTKSFSFNAYCGTNTLPNGTLLAYFDLSTRTNTTPTRQPELTVCSVGSIQGNNFVGRRLLQTPISGSGKAACNLLSCNTNNANVAYTTTLYWDSFDVSPEYSTNSATLDQRNFNDMGTITTFNSGVSFPYGNGKNFRGRFPDLRFEVPQSSFAASSPVNGTGVRYISWTTFQNGWPVANTGSSCKVTQNSNWMLNGCSNLFVGGTGGIWSKITGVMNVPGNGNDGQPTLSSINVLQVKNYLSTAGSMKFQVWIWNGPPGLSCYNYRSFAVCTLCNTMASTPSITPSTTNSMWDGGRFPGIKLTGNINYQQYTTGSSAGQTIAGNYFSLTYTWNVLQSPMGSQLNIGHGASWTRSMGTWQSATVQNSTTSQVVQNGVTYNQRSSSYNRTTTYLTEQTMVSITNHDYKLPVTCLVPDVAGTNAYIVKLTVNDGCTSWNAQTTVSATCNQLPSISSFKVSVASGKTQAGNVNVGATAPITVDGTRYDRVTVRANAATPAGSDILTYQWYVRGFSENTSFPVMNQQGTIMSFVPTQLPQWQPNSVQTYEVTMVATNGCPDSNGVKMTKRYTVMLTITCDPGFTASAVTFPEVRVMTNSSGTMKNQWWGGNSTRVQMYSNTTTFTQTTCSLTSNNGGPSRFCGAGLNAAGSAAVGIPTVLYMSTKYMWYGRRFEVDSSYSLSAARCAVKDSYWQLSMMQCALPYVPTATIIPVALPKCKPAVTAWWTIASTPCKKCYNGMGIDQCTFTNYWGNFNQAKYTKPSFQNGGTASCVYDVNGRMYGPNVPGIAAKQANCRTSGVGMEVVASSGLTFKPAFPGAYVLNYTVSDGCNMPIIKQVTVTAQCITKINNPVLRDKTVGFYCQGNAQSTSQTPQTGAFVNVQLRQDLVVTSASESSSAAFNNPVPNGQCMLPANNVMNCTSAQNKINSDNTFMVAGLSSQTNKFQSCCKCLYGMSLLSGSTSSGVVVVNQQVERESLRSAGPAKGARVAMFTEDSVHAEAGNSAMGVVAPVSVLLVASVVANVALFVRRRKYSLPM